LKRSGPFGTHSIRKTGYLLAIWGNGHFALIMQAARHKDVASALKYSKDAGALLKIANLNHFDVAGTN
jgi:hypothetical protein